MTFVDQWLRLKNAFIKKRGSFVGRDKKRIPLTTMGDVLALSVPISDKILSVKGKALTDADLRKWGEGQKRLIETAKIVPFDGAFPYNQWFWDLLLSTSMALDARKMVPSTLTKALESVVEASKNLPKTLAKAGVTAGKIAVSPLKGAAQGVGLNAPTIIVGALVVGGLVYVARKD